MPGVRKLFTNFDFLIKAAVFLCLIGMFTGLSFFLNMSGGTLFLFTVPGTGCIVTGIFLFCWVLYHDFKQRHALFEEELFPSGSIVFNQGDPGDKMYLIREGKVEVFQVSDGKEQVIRELKEGDYFGEIALLAEGKRTASIRALTDLKIVSVGRDNFQSLITNLPIVGNEFMQTFRERRETIKSK